MTRQKSRRLLVVCLGLFVLGGAFVVKTLQAPLALVGQRAPDFSLPDQDGTATQLADARGKWVVLVFYPVDSSRGCTLQNKALSAHESEFQKRNALVWAISTGNLASKRVFCANNAFTHRLLSDSQGAVARDYRVALPLPGIAIANRVTVIVDPAGRVAAVDNAVNPATSNEVALRMLDRLREGVK